MVCETAQTVSLVKRISQTRTKMAIEKAMLVLCLLLFPHYGESLRTMLHFDHPLDLTYSENNSVKIALDEGNYSQ